MGSPVFLYIHEFVVFKFELVAHVTAKGQQGDGDFGDYASVVITDEGIVPADVNDGAKHRDVLSVVNCCLAY